MKKRALTNSDIESTVALILGFKPPPQLPEINSLVVYRACGVSLEQRDSTNTPLMVCIHVPPKAQGRQPVAVFGVGRAFQRGGLVGNLPMASCAL